MFRYKLVQAPACEMESILESLIPKFHISFCINYFRKSKFLLANVCCLAFSVSHVIFSIMQFSLTLIQVHSLHLEGLPDLGNVTWPT